MDFKQLSDEEKRYLCDNLRRKDVLKAFEALVRKCPKDKSLLIFNTKLKQTPKANPQAVSDYIFQNSDKPIVIDFMDFQVKNWLLEIEKCMLEKKAINPVLSELAALLSIFHNSVFHEMPELYFKLQDKEYSDEFIEVFCHSLALERELASIEPQQAVELPAEDTDALHHQINELLIKNEELTSALSHRKDEAEETVRSLNEQIATLKQEKSAAEHIFSIANTKLEEYNSEIKTLNEKLEEAKEQLQKYQLPESSVEKYPYRSLCMVDNSDWRPWLIRLADVSGHSLSSVYINEEKERKFENRDRLFVSKDSPNTHGFIGIWDWNAIPNISDPSNDYVEVAYNSEIVPVEIIDVPNCNRIDELIAKLQDGITASPCTSRTMFAVYTSQGKQEGVLCNSEDLDVEGETVKLGRKVFSLPQYRFSTQNRYSVNGKVFYRSVILGPEQERIQIIDPLEIVKNILKERMTNPAARAANVFKKDRDNLRNLLAVIETEDYYSEIASACGCDIEQAKEYSAQLVRTVEQHIQREDIISETVADVVKNHTGLSQYCKSLVREEWIAEHDEQIQAANALLEEAERSIEQKQKINDELDAIYQKKQQLIQQAEEEIERQNQLAQDVEKKVAARIEEAQKNAADFISQMSFHVAPQSNPVVSVSLPEQNVSKSHFVEGEAISDNIKSIRDRNDFLELLSNNLVECGVSQSYAHGFACYLYSCYVNGIPILLAGPSAKEIAHAFSLSMYGKTAGFLDCAVCEYRDSLPEITNTTSELIVLSNPFTAGWCEHIPDLTGMAEKYFFFVHPYTEDILIEPKSVFSYMMPVLTELILDEFPSGEYDSGLIYDKFKHHPIQKRQKYHRVMLNQWRLNPLTIGSIQQVLTDMKAMSENKNADYDCLFCLAPYAYISNHGEHLVDKIDAGQKELTLSHNVKDLIKAFFGTDE